VSLSNDGAVVGFSSSAQLLDSIDSNSFADAYVHESAFGPAMSATIASQNPATLAGGNGAILRVAWSEAVPLGGTILRIFSPSLLSVPSHVSVPAGRTEALIQVVANHPSSEQVIKVRIVNRDVEALVPVTIKPLLKSVDFVSPQIGGSQVTQANVVLNGPAGAGGATVSLSSSNPSLLQVPANVTVLPGQTSRGFAATVGTVNTNQYVTVTARLLGYTFTRQVTISLWISSLVPTVPSVIGGNPTAARVFLVQPAPAGGLVVNLSKNSAKLSMPTTVTVPAGSKVASFSISTGPVTSTTATTVYASYGGYSRAAAITLEPNTVASLMLSPMAVKGGNASLATVTLISKAATGGVSVALTSNSPKATLPSNIAIPAGSQSKTFYVLTQPTTTAVTATITASLHGVTRVQSLTINP
jgi:trimeric autotransporter adhesin